MKQAKNSETMPNRQSKDTDIIFKKIVSDVKKENRYLRKQVREVKESRDAWKSKYFDLKNSKNTSNITKAKHHQFPIIWVMLLLELHKYGGMSLRSCRHCLVSFSLILSIDLKRIPSHGSIRNWLLKVSYCKIKSAEKKVGKYVLYVDESIVFGAEKILLILGIKEEDISFQRAVIHSDVEVLYVGFGKEWKAEMIAKKIEEIKTNKEISYVVSDQGANLVKAYLQTELTHIEDITHIMANVLKKIYGKNEAFDSFVKLIGNCRKIWWLNKEKSQYIPPKMRHKMRFANIFPCVDWANKMLENWQGLSEEIKGVLVFLWDNKVFFEELKSIGALFKNTCEMMKNKTFNVANKSEISKKIKGCEGGNLKIFSESIQLYLDGLSEKMEKLKRKNLLCSSDIIERFFGKFKYKTTQNSRNGLTEFVFTLANFTGNLSFDDVKNGLESIQIKDLKTLKI